MDNKQIQLTKEGLEALKKELTDLVEIKRPKLVDRLAYARSQGDLSENSDYHNAKEELEFLDGRIEELENVIENATVVTGASNGGISVGAHVTLKTNGNTHTYEIVGEWEADPLNKKISPESPLGRALFGRRVGETIEVKAPAGKLTYEIVAID